MTRIEYRCSVKKDHGTFSDDAIALDRVMPGSEAPQGLTISFKRTIRVPDNTEVNNLPPDLGSFPLYKVSDHRSRLPNEIVRKGGVFFPMHHKEAMWVCFRSTAPFKIKMFAGGINVISGEKSEENVTSQTGCMSLQSPSQNTQDYILVPQQRWIDGIAVKPGVVRQFVAMPLGQGYTVKAQLTGEEVKGGLQLEITPAKIAPQLVRDFYVIVKTLTGKNIKIPVSSTDFIDRLKDRIQEKQGIPKDQQCLIMAGETLRDSLTVADYLIPKMFKDVTGTEASPCPINAQTYVDAGLPFFEIFEETPSDVSGARAFAPLKSVNEMDTAQGLTTGQEPMMAPRTVKLHDLSLGTMIWSEDDVFHVDDPDGLLNPDGPRRNVRKFAGSK